MNRHDQSEGLSEKKRDDHTVHAGQLGLAGEGQEEDGTLPAGRQLQALGAPRQPVKLARLEAHHQVGRFGVPRQAHRFGRARPRPAGHRLPLFPRNVPFPQFQEIQYVFETRIVSRNLGSIRWKFKSVHK